MREPSKLLLCVALVGCTFSVDDDVAVDSELIAFSPMYSAFDGTHDYAVTPNVPSAAPSSKDEDPVMASSLVWEIDGAYVKRKKLIDPPAAIQLTTKKVGVTTVAVTGRTLSGRAIRGESKLFISKANESEWEEGEERYTNGPMVVDRLPATEVNGVFCAPDLALEIPKPSACGACHNATSELTIEQTPTQTAGYSNDELIKLFAKGERPGDEFKSAFLRSAPMPICIYREFHTWEMSDELKRGIVWKLRSIAPKVEERY